MRFGQQLFAVSALLPAAFAGLIEFGPAFDMPDFDLGAPAGASTVKVDVGEGEFSPSNAM